METQYDVIITRSKALAPDPRVERLGNALMGNRLHCLAIGWDREGSSSRRESVSYYDIIRVKLYGKHGWGIWNLVSLIFWNICLFYFHLRLRPKVIHAYDLDTVLPALLVRAIIKCKVVYDIADWYADSRKVGLLKPIVNCIERLACRLSDVVILAHEERLKQVGFTPQRWLSIYNTPPDVSINLIPSINSYFAYVGVLQPDRGLDQIIAAAKSTGYKFVLAGFGPLDDFCKNSARHIKNIDFLGKIPYDRTLMIEGNATAIIALYNPNIRNNQLAAPNKLYEAMMLARPIITTKGTLAGRLVEKEGIGFAIPYGDTQSLVNVLHTLTEIPKIGQGMGQRARVLYDTKYGYREQYKKINKLYKELTAE